MEFSQAYLVQKNNIDEKLSLVEIINSISCKLVFMISFKEFVGKKPPADIIVKVRFKPLNSLIPDIENITKMSKEIVKYKNKI